MGRDPNCGITIADEQASRLHCTIERRQDKWFLIDHSTNGTYVSVDGADDNATLFAKNRTTRLASTTLTLVYRDKSIVRRRDRDSVTIGRDPHCGITIADDQASRLHCTIERRQDKWFLIDHSTNGTYVTVDGADDVLVQREEFTLSGRGRIACGQPSVATKEIVAFTVD
jgi:pSer/pThr/pTyr-binding forkhead associated (FHA) protein